MNSYLIYGGSGGIGSALARLLHQRGQQVHLAGRNEAKMKALATELGCGYSVGDVLDPMFFGQATQDAGETLAGLAYAVGTINLGAFPRLSEEDFLRDFRVNASGAALAVQAALSKLKKCDHTASVVLFSSVAAQQGFKLHASIGMAKGAVSGLTLSLAADLAPKIRVNAIAPSLTRTPMAEGLLGNTQMEDAIAGLHALPRLGAPEDMAQLAAFLLSEESDWITGQIIGVDGGRSTLRTKA